MLKATVYVDYALEYNQFYVMISGEETKEFPHGVSLARTYETYAQARTYADKVEKYLNNSLK